MGRLFKGAGKRFLLFLVAILFLVGGGCAVHTVDAAQMNSTNEMALLGEDEVSAEGKDTGEQNQSEIGQDSSQTGEGTEGMNNQDQDDNPNPGEEEKNGTGDTTDSEDTTDDGNHSDDENETGESENAGGSTGVEETEGGDETTEGGDSGGDNTSEQGESGADDEIQDLIPATDLDIGDVMPIILGNSQVLSVTTIPVNSTDSITYTSLTPNIASVNAIGRVKGLAYGTATIQIQAGEVVRTVKISVTREETQEVETDVAATAIDVTYEASMHRGGSQMLSASLLPVNATDTVRYTSDNTAVITVNDFGRVEAIDVGDAVITARAGRVKKTFTIHVSEKAVPTDIDFEMPDDQLRLGSSVTIGATVLPTDAEDQKIQYTSSDTSILTVNALGRVTGRALGTATVLMEVGTVQKSIEFTVVEELVVSNIEVSEFNEKMKVDSTQNLNTTVFPTDAKDQKISYSSSNPAVATVAENGMITAKARGTTKIGLKAGKAYKELALTVYVATEELSLPETYLILHPGETYQILAEVRPKEADQNLTYESTNENVAKVSKRGVISAVSSGRASVVLKNDDAMVALTVIVNEGTPETDNSGVLQDSETVQSTNETALASRIREANGNALIQVSGDEVPALTEDVLLALYETKAELEVRYEDSYQLTIQGAEIKNIHNALFTDIRLTENEDGLWFYVNESRNMPGPVRIRLSDLDSSYRYAYMEETDGTYKRIKLSKDKTVDIGVAGKYLLTKKKISNNQWMLPVGLTGGGVLLAGIVAYCVVKKKYWLW